MAKNFTMCRVQKTDANRQRVIEQAEAFLAGRLGEPVGIDDLCTVTGVSERALRNAFRAVLGTSPKRYMLRARLERVHRTLAQGEADTVTTVATDHGFYELGRFASTYRQKYGEYPSDTLRNAIAQRRAH